MICLGIGVLLGAALLAGWIHADWNPDFHVSGRRNGLPLWAASIWIGVFALALGSFGISQLRTAALFRPAPEAHRKTSAA